MYLRYFYPEKRISQFVNCYFIIDTSLLESQINDLIIPDGTFGLLFINSQETVKRNIKTGTSPIRLKKSTVFGQKTHSVNYFYDQGKDKIFGVKLNPAGLALFIDDNLGGFKNSFVTIDDLNNLALSILEQKIFEVDCLSEKIKLVNDFIHRKLSRLIGNENYTLFSAMVDYIIETNGKIKFEDLTKIFNVNYKKIERLFNHYLGITPKTYIRIVRFNTTIILHSKNKHSNLTHLGYEMGFFDQSHFIREFKSFTTLTPRKFFNNPVSLPEENFLKRMPSFS